MRNSTLLDKSDSKSESVGDLPCLISGTHQNQNRLENALEISQVRFLFEPKESEDYDEQYHPDVPSSKDMIKLINLNEDQDRLQITLRLDDIERNLQLDTSQKIFCKNIPLHKNSPQNKYKGNESEILIDQEREEGIVETFSCMLHNRNFFKEESPETTDTLKCEATTQTNLTETQHRDSQTDANATDLTPVCTLEPKSSVSKAFTDSSVQCDELQKDFIHLKNFLLKEAKASCSFSSATEENESNTSEIDSKVTIEAHSQTENSSDLTHSYHNRALDKSYFPNSSAHSDIQYDMHNQPGFVNSSISSLHTFLSEWLKTSTNTVFPFIGQNNAHKSVTSTTSQTDIKTTKDSICQTYTGADLAINNSHSMKTKSETKEFCSDQTESIPAIEVTNKISKCPLIDSLKPLTVNCILSKSQVMACNIIHQTNTDFSNLKDSETHKNFNLSGNNMEIISLNSAQITDEKIHSLFPQSSTSNESKQIPVRMTHENKPSFDSNAKIQHEFFNADRIAGDSKTEKTLPIPPRTSNSVPEWTAKSFDFVRNEPLEPIIENLSCVELLEHPTRVHQNPHHFSSVNCNKGSEACRKDLLSSRSTLSIGGCDFRLVCAEEPQNSPMTVVFSQKSHPLLETNGHFVICLCDDCYTRTQQTVEENFVIHGTITPATDKVEFKPLCIESSSPTDGETAMESGTVVTETASINSVIESLYPLCEALNDHLLGLKEVDEDLLSKSKNFLTTKWLTVATDRYSRPKEVCNYLQYFQEFSDTLAKFVLNSTDSEGNNALHFAYGNNRFDMAEELLNNKHGLALLRKRNKLGHTPLMICVVSQPETQEDWNTVKKSVKMGNINEASPSSGQTALMNAASRGLEDMVRILLSAGADPNQCDRDGSTALMYATEQGREACVALILQHPGCDPLIKDQDGQTASSIAIGAGHKDIALRIYLHTKKIPPNAMQQAMKAHKKKNLPYMKV